VVIGQNHQGGAALRHIIIVNHCTRLITELVDSGRNFLNDASCLKPYISKKAGYVFQHLKYKTSNYLRSSLQPLAFEAVAVANKPKELQT